MSQALEVISIYYDVGVQHKSLPVWMYRMSIAIKCAIAGGLEFDRTDFQTIMGWRNTRWVGENTFENFYSIATGMQDRSDVRNQSALEALEQYLERPVYNYDGGRLYVGRQLYLSNDLPSPHKNGWQDSWWKVSSFRDGAEPYVNLYSTSGLALTKSARCRMTPTDVRTLEKARKEFK